MKKILKLKPYWSLGILAIILLVTITFSIIQIVRANPAVLDPGHPWSDIGDEGTEALPVNRGGTGTTTLTGVLVGNGTSAVTAVTGTASQVLRRNAGNTAYEFFTLAAGDMVLADVQTVTGAKTFGTIGGAVGKLILAGSTSGSTILNAAAIAGTTTLTLQGTTGTIYSSGGTDITVADGGTGASTLTGVLIGNGTSAITGTSILTSANGGTGNGFTKFSGPATAEKIFTLPDASATILTDNTDVTVAQGGTGVSTLGDAGVLVGNGTGAVQVTGAGNSGQVLTSNGAGVDPTFQAAAGGNDPRIITKALSANLTNSGTTFAKVTNLDQVVGVGTWAFKYLVMYRSDTTTTGIKFAVNHTGTVTSFVANGRYQENTTAAATGAADQTHITFGLVAGGATRAKSTSTALVQTASVDTINADMLMVIEGLMVVTVSGNIELYSAGEAATVTTVMKDSSLVLTKIQ